MYTGIMRQKLGLMCVIFLVGGVVSSLMKLVSGCASEPGPHKEVHFISESGLVDIFFLLGPGPKDVLQQYTGLTGVTPLPQVNA